jgi:hypothetical protein
MIRINGKSIWFLALAFLFFAGILYCAWQAYASHGQNFGLTSILWIFGAGAFGGGIKLLMRISQGSKICPHCNKDFTSCPASFCHKKDSRCEACDVNWHLVAILGRKSGVAGNSLPILYCPGCGNFVESEYYRKNSEPWYLRGNIRTKI